MQSRRIGDTQVSAIGLGAMSMSLPGRPDEQQSIATRARNSHPCAPSGRKPRWERVFVSIPSDIAGYGSES